jgi:hypothetical protein
MNKRTLTVRIYHVMLSNTTITPQTLPMALRPHQHEYPYTKLLAKFAWIENAKAGKDPWILSRTAT